MVLSDHEQRVWDDVERFWAEESEEPPRPAPLPRTPREPADLPTLVVAGAWGAILLVLFGALTASLAVGVATALGWALWRYWPRLGQADTTTWAVLHEVREGVEAWRAAGIKTPVLVPLAADGRQMSALRDVFAAFAG